ncbi:hypothetical protein EMIHUDRAFT_110169 [Emiliania huxleyi CCMP1516]|uniref:Hexosyltransferase n=2 Tax=Emiliania huxleyi TaxID=2903 RepID=A0A0D3KL74_EMIH1|nr:hypothetical protein EMIHUDRAFT_110169 [Emiliania huxleyi CCMP1516]EOD36509.1 hypothetical protein EMIHUDRAFT_110169 [Emiliania huxleyi CCMP1516]|eukprot:XP_005788938.1 hypothetical protein EMIHUDRAFT_110169 [Emiliania huxleyi CCMP1516]
MIKSLLHHYSWPSPLQIHVMADEASDTTLAEFLASACGGAWLRCKLHTRAMVFQTVAQLMPASASALLQRSALDFSTLVKVALPHVLPADVISLVAVDADVLWRADVAELWAVFETARAASSAIAFGMALDAIRLRKWKPQYWLRPYAAAPYNGGLVLMDLARARSQHWLNVSSHAVWRALGAAGPSARLEFGDQDWFNAAFARHPAMVAKLPCTWNIQLSALRFLPKRAQLVLPCGSLYDGSAASLTSGAKLLHGSAWSFPGNTGGRAVDAGAPHAVEHARYAAMAPCELPRVACRAAEAASNRSLRGRVWAEWPMRRAAMSPLRAAGPATRRIAPANDDDGTKPLPTAPTASHTTAATSRVELVIGVLGRAAHVERRDAIRHGLHTLTFAYPSYHLAKRVALAFVLGADALGMGGNGGGGGGGGHGGGGGGGSGGGGSSAASALLRRSVRAEMRRHGDILVANCSDSDGFVPGGAVPARSRSDPEASKLLALLRWAIEAHPRAGYIMRIHDDTYVRVHALLRAIRAEPIPTSHLIWGRFVRGCRNDDVQRLRAGGLKRNESLWLCMLPKSLRPSFAEGLFLFLPYPSGLGWVYSRDVAEWVAHSRLPFRRIWPADATAGLWTAALDIRHFDDERFHDISGRGGLQRWCDATSLAIHYMDARAWAAVDRCGCLACGNGTCPPPPPKGATCELGRPH